MRRGLATFLVTVLLWGGLPSFAAEVPMGENLLPNPGFDILYTHTDTNRRLPEYWGWSFWDEGFTKVSAENPKSGDTCVEIKRRDNGKPSICSREITVTPGDTYTVGYSLCSPLYSAPLGGFCVEFTYKDADGVKMPHISGSTLWSVPTTVWTEYKQEFIIPEGVKTVTVWFVLPSKGTVYLDDVFFAHTKEKSPFSLKTDAVFYYTDDPTPCEITVSDAGDKGEKVHFSLIKKNVPQPIRNGEPDVFIPFENGMATLTFPVSTLSAVMSEYVLRAEVLNKNGEVLETLEKKLYRYPRPARLGSDGVCRKNGEPFMPVIGYHIDLPEADGENQLTKSKEIGVNVVTLSHFYADVQEIVNALNIIRANNMMAIVCLYKNGLPAGHSTNTQNTMAVLAAIKEKKLEDSVFAFALMDEPMLHDRARPEDTMHVGYRIVRETIPEIPVICVDHRDNARDYKRIADYCDILMSDAYPAGASLPLPLWEYVHTNLSFAKESADKGDRVLYSLLQGCEWYGLFLTAEELRHTAMQSFLAGARAIGYYGVNDGGGTDAEGNPIPLWSFSERWSELKTFTSEFETLYRHFNQGLSTQRTTFCADGLCGELWQDGEDMYAVLVNFSGEKEVAADIPLPMENVLWTRYRDGAFTWAEGENTLYTLRKGEAALLQFKKIGDLKFFVGETETDCPRTGETVRAETVLPEACKTSFLAIYAKDGEALVSLIPLTGEAANGLVKAAATFVIPKGSSLSYKHVLWDGLVPKMSQSEGYFKE